MTNNELLTVVKQMLGVSGTALDGALLGYISEVRRFCKNAGVKDTVLQSMDIVGVVARGVCDLWNYGVGGVDYSPAFYSSLAQLRLQDGSTAEGESIGLCACSEIPAKTVNEIWEG